jgi:hypothetical protein
VAFLVDNQAALYIWNLVIFIVFGIALAPLVLVLRERLRVGSPESPGLAQAAGAFGLIWTGLVLAAGMVSNIAIGTVADLYDTDPAAAEPVWSALDSVQNGLGDGNEIAGGVWVLLVSWAAPTTAVQSRPCHRIHQRGLRTGRYRCTGLERSDGRDYRVASTVPRACESPVLLSRPDPSGSRLRAGCESGRNRAKVPICSVVGSTAAAGCGCP